MPLFGHIDWISGMFLFPKIQVVLTILIGNRLKSSWHNGDGQMILRGAWTAV